MRRCEYIERKTPSKEIIEFLKHFSSRSHHKLFFGPPCILVFSYYAVNHVSLEGNLTKSPKNHFKKKDNNTSKTYGNTNRCTENWMNI